VAVVGDIEKAFLNVKVKLHDRDCLQFLWVNKACLPVEALPDFRIRQSAPFSKVGIDFARQLRNG